MCVALCNTQPHVLNSILFTYYLLNTYSFNFRFSFHLPPFSPFPMTTPQVPSSLPSPLSPFPLIPRVLGGENTPAPRCAGGSLPEDCWLAPPHLHTTHPTPTLTHPFTHAPTLTHSKHPEAHKNQPESQFWLPFRNFNHSNSLPALQTAFPYRGKTPL